MRTGGCQCGQVRYRCPDKPLELFVCHCRECRKQSASAFGISYIVAREQFELTDGSPRFWIRAADSGNQVRCAFCSDCGSRLWHESSPDQVSVKAGSLHDPVDISTAVHIWVSRKLDGITIPDGVRQFPEEPD